MTVLTGRGVVAAAGVAGALGVALGAFGAHALRGRLAPTDLAVFETAVRYQLIHTVALFGVGVWMGEKASRWLGWAARLFVAGIAIFSGSLYLLVLLDLRWLGAVTPFGGVALIAGWLAIVAAALGASDRR